VRKGIAFRDAHEIVGKTVRYAIDRGQELAALSLDELRTFSAAIDDDVYAVLTVEGSVAARNHPGGTAPAQVRAAIARARRELG
jgi:argininosuccinate lyase